ncbi:MAG: Gfo/Idh/MocA family oxidoreductase [Candidatus Omnitrophica bacterium]|nr:Gfo/Idh/MocA family oxidoreductase [Candidatus Omnitrophota bacterium]MBI3009958.1 Gfo/Idh/MocA family oxidoreductase [Candidatus Omnitrophota bacterium]
MPSVLRVGLIGAGCWGQVYLRTLAPLRSRCRVTHLCTRFPKRAAILGYPVEVVSDWKKLIRSECDAVIVASPAPTHAAIVKAALEAGKPCLVEKPLCLDVDTAEKLHLQSKRSGIPVLVDHTLLFSPAYAVLADTLKEKGQSIRMIFSDAGNFGPFRSQTSALWDWGSHDVSLCLDLLGSFPRKVFALGSLEGHAGFSEQVSLRLDFPGGVSAWIQTGSLTAQKHRLLGVVTENRLYVWNNQAIPALTSRAIRFSRRYQEEGMASMAKTRTLPVSSRSTPLTQAILTFIDGLRGGDRSRFGTKLALDVVRVLALCEKAMKRDRML